MRDITSYPSIKNHTPYMPVVCTERVKYMFWSLAQISAKELSIFLLNDPESFAK